MKGSISARITIKVGHGIMTIPRDLEKINKQNLFSGKNEKFSDSPKTRTQ